MTDAQTILKMIEEVDPADTVKLDEIWYGRDPDHGTSAYCHSEQGPCHERYIRASRHDEALRVIAECKAALKFYDKRYSYYAHMALQAIRDFEEKK